MQILSDTGFPAEWLELELTESALMQRETEAVTILERLRGLGLHLAMDDFGTGYSSLAYLKRFPLDVLKIDKSFVDDIPHQRDDMEIAATIIAMGHILGFKVLAEGVEMCIRDRVMEPGKDNPFLQAFLPFQRRIQHYGILNSLSQTLLKLTTPGLPDFYQGTELWDLSLVDPDNRRPVNFERRGALLQALQSRANDNILQLIAELLAAPEDGQIKLCLLYTSRCV